MTTFERLPAIGLNPEHARRMIGLIVVRELVEETVFHNSFDEKRYVEHLRRLPELPPAGPPTW